MKDKRVKGAAARKAAVKKATEALQLAREKAITAKKRVSVVHGELYYNHSLALKEALDLDDPYAVPAADARGVCRRIDVRWLWPGITKEMVEIAFSQYGRINHVVMEMPTWGPKTSDPVYDRRDVRYLIAHITYSDKMSAVAAVNNMQGFRFIGANQPFEHRHMEIEVRFASDRSYDDDDDDGSDGEMHEMLRQHNDSMYMSRSLNDEGIAALYPVGVDWESMGMWDDDVLGGHGGDLADFDPDNNPDFESDREEAEYGLDADDDNF